MTDSTTCSVCLEEYTETGNKSPKLLPCSHTFCDSCCWKFRHPNPHLTFQCPECRANHWVPVPGFPTNRYVLQILDMQRKLIECESKKQVERATAIDPEQAKHVKCQVHGKPYVMFCLRKECWKALCPKCHVQKHQNHDVVGLFECIDSEKLEEMKREVINGGHSLKAYVSLLESSKATVLKNAKEVNKDIQKIAAGMKNMIDAKAKQLTKKVQRNSDKQVAELEAVQKTFSKDFSSGKQIELDVDILRVKNSPLSVQRLIDIKNRCEDFKKSVQRKRKMNMDYTTVRLNRNKRQRLNYHSLIGKINLTRKTAK